MKRALIALVLLGCPVQLGCTASAEPTGYLAETPRVDPPGADSPGADSPGVAEAAAPAEAPGPQVFGSAIDESMPLTSIAAIVEDPQRYRDRVVRTEGQIARVCQRMGCWMELRDGEDGPAVRVPMAGHNFFLPRDAAGRHATMQGRVALVELSPATRAHLESEGAVETRSSLSIEATGVAID